MTTTPSPICIAPGACTRAGECRALTQCSTLAHSHTGGDGFQRRCPSCGGETSPISHTDPRMSCDNCGDILPCCT